MNKYDLVNDEEIVEEYKKEFLKNLNKFLKESLNFEISEKLLNNNCFTVSAATHTGIDNWVKHLVELLKKTKEYDTVFDKFDLQEADKYKKYDVEMIVDITEKEKENLLEE
jgi:GTPase SAR1 family protein